MVLVETRTESQLGLTTSFQAMNNLAASAPGSTFQVAAGINSIKKITAAVALDDVQETIMLIGITGNGVDGGSAYFTGPSLSAMPSSVGANQSYVEIDTDLKVTPGRSLSIEVAGTDAATVSASVTLHMA
jgi:hypothetical protein